MNITVLGLSLSSSWGNGHATTYRGLLKALSARGHDVLFLERDQPWYAAHRDLPKPDFCGFALYDTLDALDAHKPRIARSDITIIGSYVPDGIGVARKIRPWAGKLAFYDIDTPVTLAALRAGTCAYLAPSLIPQYDLYLSFTGGPTLRLLEQHYGSPAARALYCAADPTLYQPPQNPGPPRWDLGYLGTYSPDRQPTLETLLIEPARRAPHRRFVVAGPQYPDSIAWPENVDRIAHLPPADHAAFYGALGWTLNVTRADMIAAGYSPSVRLFEAAACATPIISDIWDGIGDILQPDRDIMLAKTPEDILACLTKPESDRRAIGQAARSRFLTAHTAAHRAKELENLVTALPRRKAQAAAWLIHGD
jgi:spore maturation protein CgeB